jgi:hypothetical protein
MHTANSYREGYRAGYADALLGITLLVAVLASWGDYARGYSQGQTDQKTGKEWKP